MPARQGPPDPETTPVRRGRRDPEIIRRMAEDDDQGVVRVVDDGSDFEPDDPGYDEPDSPFEDEGPSDFSEDDQFELDPGDRVFAKIVHPVEFPDSSEASWVTFGAESKIRPGESEEQGFVRVATIVSNRVYDLAVAAEKPLADAREHMKEVQQELDEERRQERRTRRITPQGR